MQKDHHTIHTPVLLEDVLQYLAPVKGENLLDVTAGYGGHSAAILDKTDQYKQSLLVDRDNNAIDELNQKFTGTGISVVHNDFARATKLLEEQDRHFDLILADLGVSSPHLDNASRGFSFQKNGPLDMRMDTSVGMTAADLLNSSSEDAITSMLRRYGEEPKASRIAKAIVAARPLETTDQLAMVIVDVYGGRGRYKTHPATKTFQALRIAVNDELTQLSYALPLWLKMLKTGGRIAIISFHSLEDRIVKQFLAEHSGDRYDASLRLLTKKPITGRQEEIVLNPRARSAKLRVAVKK